MYCVGDLVRIPSNVKMFKNDSLKVINDFKLTNEPQMAIFIKYLNDGSCFVNSDGEQWCVDIDKIRMVDFKNDKVSSNIKNL
jgi:hypothetical protein